MTARTTGAFDLDLPALCAQLERRLPGTSFTIASFSDYVAAVAPDGLPAYAGELLGSRLQNVLRGVNSARMYLKRANERAERRLLEVETLATLRTLQTGQRFPVSDFRLAWRELLKCHPHDSICGCSCDEVHRDMLVRYEQLERTVSHLERRALEGLGAGEGTAGVINLLPCRRRGLVELPGHEPAIVELDGFSARPVELTPPQATGHEPRDGSTIESDLIRVVAAPDGTVTLLDKATGKRFEHLHRLEDEPDIGDLYNFCPSDGVAPGWSASASVRVLRDGPVVWELEIRMPTVSTVVRLVTGIRRVEFSTTIDNATEDHRLRAVFPVGTLADAGTTVRAEGQFALVHRPLVPPAPKTDWCEPPDATHHTLGAVALGPLALLTKGLPEYEARQNPTTEARQNPTNTGAELCLTLLRCVGMISRPAGAIATRPVCAGPPTETPDGQCLGRHEFEYALLPGTDELDDAELVPGIPGLPLRVPHHLATGEPRPSDNHRRRRRVLVPEGRRGRRRADPALLQPEDLAGEREDRRRVRHLPRPPRRGRGRGRAGPRAEARRDRHVPAAPTHRLNRTSSNRPANSCGESPCE